MLLNFDSWQNSNLVFGEAQVYPIVESNYSANWNGDLLFLPEVPFFQ